MKGATIKSIDGQAQGVATGGRHKCRTEGCKGHRIAVKWEDGTRTYPCTQGLKTIPGGFQII